MRNSDGQDLRFRIYILYDLTSINWYAYLPKTAVFKTSHFVILTVDLFRITYITMPLRSGLFSSIYTVSRPGTQFSSSLNANRVYTSSRTIIFYNCWTFMSNIELYSRGRGGEFLWRHSPPGRDYISITACLSTI